MARLARCVCFVCVPRLSFVGFVGEARRGVGVGRRVLSPREGRGRVGAERVGAGRGEREGRASCKSIVWLQERSRRQKKKKKNRKKEKNLSKDLARALSLPLPLAHSLALRAGAPRSWRRQRREHAEERRLSGGQVQGSPQSAIQKSHGDRGDRESRGAGRGQAGAEAGGPRSGRSAARVRGNQHESGPRRALRGVVLALGRRRRLPRAPGARLARSGRRRRPLAPDGGRSPIPRGPPAPPPPPPSPEPPPMPPGRARSRRV